MKLATVVLVTAFLAGCATGENITPLGTVGGWVKIAEYKNKEQVITKYVHPGSILNFGNNIVNMRILEDYNSLQGFIFRYKSLVIQKTFYCENDQIKRTNTVFWSGNMARGRFVYGMGPDKFSESGGGPAWKYACKK